MEEVPKKIKNLLCGDLLKSSCFLETSSGGRPGGVETFDFTMTMYFE